jgi:hypothetical protein
VKKKITTLANPERQKINPVANVAAEGRVFSALPKPLAQRTMLTGMRSMKYTTG